MYVKKTPNFITPYGFPKKGGNYSPNPKSHTPYWISQVRLLNSQTVQYNSCFSKIRSSDSFCVPFTVVPVVFTSISPSIVVPQALTCFPFTSTTQVSHVWSGPSDSL